MRFPCVHAVTTTPAQRLGYNSALPPSPISLPRNGGRVGLRNVLFEDCSVFTHITACTLAEPPKVIRYIKGFSYFVTSITAPIASGWSKIAGWDSHPLGKRRLYTAHAMSRLTSNTNKLCQSDPERGDREGLWLSLYGFNTALPLVAESG